MKTCEWHTSIGKQCGAPADYDVGATYWRSARPMCGFHAGYSKEQGFIVTKQTAEKTQGSDCETNASSSSEQICTKYGCWRMPLKHMAAGDSHQTKAGFFTIHISGLYCPNCGGGYGA